MMIRTAAIVALALICICTGALGYSFWGITLGTDTYQNMNQLTFNGVGASGAQYSVGGYKYTGVDGAWYGPYSAAEPGEGYAVHRQMDAQAMFFTADSNSAHFVIISGVPQTGVAAPECGYGSRLFGPGDLHLVANQTDYGVGIRLSNLLWAEDPNTTNSYYQIHTAEGGVDNIHASDAGTMGSVERDPRWDHVDNPGLPANSEQAHAFFVKGSGTQTGNASVSYEDTGALLYGAKVYAYKVDVPWTALGLTAKQYEIRATWGPTCGNDLIAGNFTGSHPGVPEPASILAFSAGLIGLLAYRKRRAHRI